MPATLSVADLGTLTGPLVIYGGPYSNLQATQALFDWADAQGVPPGQRICTGDIVAYAGQPLETAREVQRRGGPVVAGNTDRQLATGAGDCGCGFAEGSACDRLSAHWFAHAQSALAGDAVLDWFGAFPDLIRFTHAGRRVAVIHGGVTDIARFLWPSSPETAFAEEIAAVEAAAGPVDTVFAGHSGVAFHRRIGAVDWMNAGAIGLPPHDGRPRTRFLSIEATGKPFIEHLAYDHAAAGAAMHAAGLPDDYARTLQTGIWPSEDILPPEMRR